MSEYTQMVDEAIEGFWTRTMRVPAGLTRGRFRKGARRILWIQIVGNGTLLFVAFVLQELQKYYPQ